MKSELVILSDLWGVQNSTWIKYYYEELKDRYSINFLDSRKLAGIDPSLDSERIIHQQFVDEGIDIAVDKLLQHEFVHSTIIGFSIGGLIAWKATIKGLAARKLISISSTRLRYETQKPPIPLALFYGKSDPNSPKKQWFEKMNLNPEIIPGGHDIYKEANYINTFTKGI